MNPGARQSHWHRTWSICRRLAGLLATTAWVSACAVTAQAEEPWRVGRVSHTEGAVTLWRAPPPAPGRPSAPQERIDVPRGAPDALRNWPLGPGDRLRTAADGRAELDVGEVRLRLGTASDLVVLAVDDEQVRVHLEKGSLAWRVEPGDVRDMQVTTPLGRVELLTAGLYRADVGRNGDTFSVLRGRAEVRQAHAGITLGPGQAATLWPTGGWSLGSAEPDEFSRWALGLEQPGSRYAALPPGMTGARDLDEHGEWLGTPQWGTVWFPRTVPPGWAPYQQGRWILQPGGGWVWLDDVPWGFAPFSYGQWVLWSGRWGWVPGARVPPSPHRPPVGQPPPRPAPGVRPPEADRRVRIEPPPRPRPDAPWPGVAPAVPSQRGVETGRRPPSSYEPPSPWPDGRPAPAPGWRDRGDAPPDVRRDPRPGPRPDMPRGAPTPEWPGSRLSEPSGGLGLRPPPGAAHRPSPEGPEAQQRLRTGPPPAVTAPTPTPVAPPRPVTSPPAQPAPPTMLRPAPPREPSTGPAPRDAPRTEDRRRRDASTQ